MTEVLWDDPEADVEPEPAPKQRRREPKVVPDEFGFAWTARLLPDERPIMTKATGGQRAYLVRRRDEERDEDHEHDAGATSRAGDA